MKFSSAEKVEQVVWNMKLSDLTRSQNRALINALFNGEPPYSEQERKDNQIEVNVNFLEAAKIAHDARRQFSNAFLRPGNFFNVKLDYGPQHKRAEWGQIVTREIGKQMKGSLHYRETLRNIFAQLVLHGIGPSVWSDREHWCPDMFMVGDILLPSRTLLTMENVEYFAIFRRYTAAQLWRMTHGPKVDPGWNLDMANEAIRWAHQQYGKTLSEFENIYSPERLEEDYKSDAGFYSSDQVPTIDCWDFYFLEDSEKVFGWNRRIVMDAPSKSEVDQPSRGKFLYDSGKRRYATKRDQIIHFQFADGSAVSPFRYHSVRSLGFLLYAVCHLQNRLRCRYNEAVFESLLQYFRTANPADAERVTKVDLVNRGIIPEGINFVGQNERWQTNQGLVESAMQMNRRSMSDNSASFTQDFDFAKEKREKTATEITAEVTATAALVGTMLQDAYGLQEFQYREIARRFCIKNSKDLDVRSFRVACLKRGVPEEALDFERWDIEAIRVMGAGNKQLEIAQANMLMAVINRYDPDAQRLILRNYTFAATDDPALTDELVPFEKNKVSDTVHDAQLAAGSLMQGLPVSVKPGHNHIEYVETLIFDLAIIIKGIEGQGGMTTAEKIVGLNNLATHIAQHIAIIAQEPSEKERVKKYSDDLAKLMNLVEAYAERLSEQNQAGNGGGADVEAMGKVQAQQIIAQAKAANMRESHAQRTQQREAQFRQKLAQDQAKSQLENANVIRRTEVEEAAKDLETASNINRQSQAPPAGLPPASE